MKNGLFYEEGHLIYYKDGRPYHAGMIKVDGELYYISSKGRAVRGQHIVHGEMTNGLAKRGTYTFGEDYKLVPGSYIPPKRRKRRRIERFLERTKKWLPGVCGLLFLGLVVIILLNSDRLFGVKEKPVQEGTTVQQTVGTKEDHVILPVLDEKVLLCSQEAKQLYDNGLPEEETVTSGSAYRPFQFVYDVGDSSGTLTVREEQDPTVVQELALEPAHRSVAVDNLKTDTAYLYTVEVDGETYEGRFETEASPRFLTVPGLSNVRDLGGWETLDGKTVKQGMLIRGCELDGMVASGHFLRPEDREQVRTTFGFVYEMDLRSESVFSGNYISRLGENVGHKFYGAPQYGEVFSEKYKAALGDIFADLADPGKYPMYLHCSYGADQTGTIVFLLQGLLNMSEEDMLLEYCLSGYESAAYRDTAKLDVLLSGLESFAGETLQERIVTFLRDTIGVTEEEIASIRSILLQ